MQLPPPQILEVFLVALDRDTEKRITDQLLPSSQYRCIVIPHFDIALELLENADLVFSNVLSNVLSKDDDDGYNFIDKVQRLRKNFPHVVIFEAEGLGDPEIIRAKQLGACYILWKPVSEQSDGIKNLRQHVAQNEDSSEDSSSSRVSSQQKSLKRKNDQQPSEKERESSKRPQIVWHKALLDLLVNAGDDNDEGTSCASDEGTSCASDGRTSWVSPTETKEKEKNKKLHQTPTTDSPPQAHVVCQQQIQHEHHEQHLPCQPMHNSGVTSLIGNRVNNLTSMPQPDGITFDILQQPDIALDLTSGMQHPCSSSRIINQNQVFGASSRTSNMQQPGTQQLGAKVW